jgi:hypothetical protein
MLSRLSPKFREHCRSQVLLARKIVRGHEKDLLSPEKARLLQSPGNSETADYLSKYRDPSSRLLLLKMMVSRAFHIGHIHISLSNQERLARIEAVREIQREQELEDCTFRPAINSTTPDTLNQPVVVPGLGR